MQNKTIARGQKYILTLIWYVFPISRIHPKLDRHVTTVTNNINIHDNRQSSETYKHTGTDDCSTFLFLNISEPEIGISRLNEFDPELEHSVATVSNNNIMQNTIKVRAKKNSMRLTYQPDFLFLRISMNQKI